MTTLTAEQREALAASFAKPDAVTMDCPDCQRPGSYTRMSGSACVWCQGTGTVTVDPDAIFAACLNSKTGKFRASSPKHPYQGGVFGASFVWRMVRYHTGLDMSMPVGVMWGYPRATQDVLHAVTDWVAWEVAGERSLTGALRWGKALGYA